MAEVQKLINSFSCINDHRSSRLSLGYYDAATGNHVALVIPGDSPAKLRQLVYDFLTFISMAYEIPCDFNTLRFELGLPKLKRA